MRVKMAKDSLEIKRRAVRQRDPKPARRHRASANLARTSLEARLEGFVEPPHGPEPRSERDLADRQPGFDDQLARKVQPTLGRQLLRRLAHLFDEQTAKMASGDAEERGEAIFVEL